MEKEKRRFHYIRIGGGDAAMAATAGYVSYITAENIYDMTNFKAHFYMPDLPISDMHTAAQPYGPQKETCAKELQGKALVEAPDYNSAFYKCLNDQISIAGSLTLNGPLFIAAVLFTYYSVLSALGFFHLWYTTKKQEFFYKMPEVDLPDPSEQGEAPIRDIPEVTYELNNGVNPILKLALDKGEEFLGEAGCLLMKDDTIEMKAHFLDWPQGIRHVLRLLASGEGAALMRFTNHGDKPADLILDSGGQNLVPVELDREEELYCKRGAFFAGFGNINISARNIWHFAFSNFSGIGPYLQNIQYCGEKASTKIFLGSEGQVHERRLEKGETVQIQRSSLMAFTQSVTLGLREIEDTGTLLFSREGRFLTEVTGPGRIWVDSRQTVHLPDPRTLVFRKLIRR